MYSFSFEYLKIVDVASIYNMVRRHLIFYAFLFFSEFFIISLRPLDSEGDFNALEPMSVEGSEDEEWEDLNEKKI